MIRTLFVCPQRVALALLMCLAALALPLRTNAQASNLDAQLKIAPDLLSALSTAVVPAVPWAKVSGGDLLVTALVASNSDDEALPLLRSFVLSLGGSVYYNYTSMRMLAVMVPASRLLDLASRNDVVSDISLHVR